MVLFNCSEYFSSIYCGRREKVDILGNETVSSLNLPTLNKEFFNKTKKIVGEEPTPLVVQTSNQPFRVVHLIFVLLSVPVSFISFQPKN